MVGEWAGVALWGAVMLGAMIASFYAGMLYADARADRREER